MPIHADQKWHVSRQELVAQEKHSLREELRDLKGYQFRLVGMAAVVTGFLLSLARLRLDPGLLARPSQSLYLLPLVVITPSWWIYFDKTKTITRIVGYCRLLEEAQIVDAEPTWFIGWESALREFRKAQRGAKHSLLGDQPTGMRFPARVWHMLGALSLRCWHELVRVRERSWHALLTISLRESQRYWTLAYGTFLILSTICLWIPIRSRLPFSSHDLRSVLHPMSWTTESLLLVGATLITFYCAAFNCLVLFRLIWGKHSYDVMEGVWREVLNAKAKASPPTGA